MNNWANLNVPKEFIPTDPRFGCGPSVIPMDHIKNLAQYAPDIIGTSHRKNAVINVLKDIHTGLRQYFNLPADYTIIIGNGGATFLWDMIGLGMCEKSSLHFTCGEFSQKWLAAHKKIPWISTKDVSAPFGEGLNPAHQDGFDLLCTTLNETSTGVQNTVMPVTKAETLVLVDATSGAGQIPCDLRQTDFYYFSPQKIFAADGGLFIGFLSPRAKERVEKLAKDSKRYIPEIMSWTQCLDYSSKFQTYNTPSIINLLLIREQLNKMNAIGRDAIEQEAQRKANLIYHWATEKKYLTPYVQKENHRSTAVATIDVDSSMPVDPLIQFLRDQKWVYDIDGYRKLGRNQLRISMFHNVSYENLKKLTQLISFLVEN